MLSFLAHRPTNDGGPFGSHFYRVEISQNLFGEYSVIREWGLRGRSGRQMIAWISNLREALVQADNLRQTAETRGYQLINCDWTTGREAVQNDRPETSPPHS